MSTLLRTEGLNVKIPIASGLLHPVRNVSFSLDRGETFCIVGESGCGKSLTALAIMDLLPSRATRSVRRLSLAGEDLSRVPKARMADIRGNMIGMIFQEPMTSLNPCYTIGNQLEETFLRHHRAPRASARERAIFLLEKVGISGADSRMRQFPHQLSGGLRQRVMIAMALMCGPDLIIADEPTTALDVTIQAQILRLLIDLQHEFGMAVILITHDLGVVARVAHRVCVMYAGEIVETGTVREIFESPLHPYTQGLMKCMPVPGRTRRGKRLGTIRGMVPNVTEDFHGCGFRNRCSYAFEACGQTDVALNETSPGRAYRCLLAPRECHENARAFRA